MYCHGGYEMIQRSHTYFFVLVLSQRACHAIAIAQSLNICSTRRNRPCHRHRPSDSHPCTLDTGNCESGAKYCASNITVKSVIQARNQTSLYVCIIYFMYSSSLTYAFVHLSRVTRNTLQVGTHSSSDTLRFLF
jgi:hypothetical protein